MGGNFSQTGDDITQGPIGVRPQSLIIDMVEEITCVVGHTPVTRLTIEEKYRIILTDAVEEREYLIIQNGVPSIGKI